MALSNIFRDPRREITESVVGIVATVVVLGGFFWADWQFAAWLDAGDTSDKHGERMALGMIFGLVLAIVGVLFFGITHAIGETVCDALAAKGIHLRPWQRR